MNNSNSQRNTEQIQKPTAIIIMTTMTLTTMTMTIIINNKHGVWKDASEEDCGQ